MGDRSHVAPDATIDLYARGDPRIARVLRAGSLRLSDIPALFSIGIAPVHGRTLVSLRISVLLRVKLSRAAADHFAGHAQAEFKRIIDSLNQAAMRQRRNANGGGQRPPAPTVSSEYHADYAVLGVQPGASLAQIQAAYREGCRKYHPDALTGKNVEPHLVDLAACRFKEISTAYRRLRDHLAPAHRV